MSKLDHYGIRGLSANWIKAFLANRSQVVLVNGSHPQPVISGVPQGTILAPVLFILYINDISENIKSQIRLFADDGIIYREINNDQDHVTLTRASRLPNICPYCRIQLYVNVYKFSFYPRTIVTWNHIPFNNLSQSTPSFKTLAMPSIKSLNVAN